MIFGTSVGMLIFTLRQKHPYADRPIIDYSASLMFLPIILIGSTAGALVNTMFPGWIISIIMVIFLAMTAVRIITKAKQQWAKESKEHAKKKEQEKIEKEQLEKENVSLTRNDVVQQEHHTEQTSSSGDIELHHSDVSEENQDSSQITDSTTTSMSPVATHEESVQSPVDIKPEEKDVEKVVVETKNTSEVNRKFTKRYNTLNNFVAELEKYLAHEKSKFPILKMLGLFFTWAIVAIATLFVGGKGRM